MESKEREQAREIVREDIRRRFVGFDSNPAYTDLIDRIAAALKAKDEEIRNCSCVCHVEARQTEKENLERSRCPKCKPLEAHPQDEVSACLVELREMFPDADHVDVHQSADSYRNEGSFVRHGCALTISNGSGKHLSIVQSVGGAMHLRDAMQKVRDWKSQQEEK